MQFSAMCKHCAAPTVSVCCSMLQCVAAHCNTHPQMQYSIMCKHCAAPTVSVCCSMLQCQRDAVCCSMLQCVAVRCSLRFRVCCRVTQCVFQCIAICVPYFDHLARFGSCSGTSCVAACRSVLQRNTCVAVHRSLCIIFRSLVPIRI